MLVLGSLPGEASLTERRYYAHPRNRFWHLIGQVIGRDLVSLPYDDRLATLISSHIALWDTVASANRDGSLDTAIREPEPTALADLVDLLPDLRAVGFNGATAARIGMPQLTGRGLALVALPSSSPANAAVPLAAKEKMWSALSEFLA